MRTTVSRSTRAWAATHRMLLAVIAFALVAAVAFAIVVLTPSGSPARTTAPSDGSIPYPEVLSGQSVPTDEDVLSSTEQACQLAGVAGC